MIKHIYKLPAYLLLILSFNAFSDSVDDPSIELTPRSGFFIGVDVATSISGEVTAEVDDEKTSSDIDTSLIGFYIGYRTKSNNRIRLARTAMDVEYKYGSDDDIPGTELDFQYVYGDDLVQPYLGFGFGLHTLKNEDNSFNDGDDLEGVSFKLQGGVKFDVHEHVELDLSLQIKSIAWEEFYVIEDFGLEKVQLTHSHTALNFGAAYLF